MLSFKKPELRIKEYLVKQFTCDFQEYIESGTEIPSHKILAWISWNYRAFQYTRDKLAYELLLEELKQKTNALLQYPSFDIVEDLQQIDFTQIMPNEILLKILLYLPTDRFKSNRLVNTKMNQMYSEPSLINPIVIPHRNRLLNSLNQLRERDYVLTDLNDFSAHAKAIHTVKAIESKVKASNINNLDHENLSEIETIYNERLGYYSEKHSPCEIVLGCFYIWLFSVATCGAAALAFICFGLYSDKPNHVLCDDENSYLEDPYNYFENLIQSIWLSVFCSFISGLWCGSTVRGMVSGLLFFYKQSLYKSEHIHDELSGALQARMKKRCYDYISWLPVVLDTLAIPVAALPMYFDVPYISGNWIDDYGKLENNCNTVLLQHVKNDITTEITRALLLSIACSFGSAFAIPFVFMNLVRMAGLAVKAIKALVKFQTRTTLETQPLLVNRSSQQQTNSSYSDSSSYQFTLFHKNDEVEANKVDTSMQKLRPPNYGTTMG